MCGITGIVERDFARPVDRAQLERMVETLRHRGPDDRGQFVKQGVGLGMRRLSIIDVESKKLKKTRNNFCLKKQLKFASSIFFFFLGFPTYKTPSDKRTCV